ncbi:hybrid sensor histidine kinase/response regulator [Terriglobus roseus]|uniref:histidine kinase n=1 Tax=Terriglobus roseus TaxID=392734 RepID=A0A1H4U486_9BACT|nr:hybrid sensor histidine kinase/response regulator [Terriglobus roseus]SEC63517.1 PAS/PAC sensor hybrid histidine kinase [Terriglobus roseus]
MSADELVPRRQLLLLLVEDNQDDAALLERHLRRNGFAPSITRVETAAEMVAAIAAGPPDLVIADYNLPNFSGPAALSIARQSGYDLPFIMMSGAISEETAVESMRAGAQDYVTKQNVARLIPVVERELREAAARKSRLMAERALAVSEARFHHLVDAMPLGLLISQSSGLITYANAAAERLLGFPPEQVLRGSITLGSLCGALDAPFAELEHRATQEPFEATCTTSAGIAVDVLVGIAFLDREQEAGQRELAVFIADLSHQKRSEEVLRRTEKLAVAGRLAASIAHEINNPLAAITNCLYLVQQTELSDLGRSYLEIAQKELDRVAQITVQTLRFHRQSSRPMPTETSELIETVLALFESRIRRQGIQIHRRYRQTSPIFAYEGEVRQVIVNLLGNAIDAMPGGGHITVRTAETHHPVTEARGLALTVCDSGSGMGEETIAHLFEPFYSTKGITGTGLGLWVSKEIVDRHHGNIRVRSRKSVDGNPGRTTFRVFLPIDAFPSQSASQ